MLACADALSLNAKMRELEGRKQAPHETLETVEPPASRLHPNLAEYYRQKVSELEVALNDVVDRAEAQAIIRSLIDRVVLKPRPDGAMDALLYGELAGMLALCGGDGPRSEHPGLGEPGCQLSVVAGAGCHLYRTKLP